MEFKDLLKSGQLKEEHTSKQKIAEFLQFAEDEIVAAKFNLSKFPLTASKSAYDALIQEGNALIKYYGYRPTTRYTHTTITEFEKIGARINFEPAKNKSAAISSILVLPMKV